MKKIFQILIIAGCAIVVFLLGPAPPMPTIDLDLPNVPPVGSLEEYIKLAEQKHPVKPDNEARVVWADSTKSKTKYALVYLHGFSASQEEGNPVHRRVASFLGANLYLARLYGHGLDTTDALLHFTSDKLWESAKVALAVGLTLGDTVILMGSSTGATLNLMMAGYYPFIKAIINYSPNIRINNPNAWLLNEPWGLQIARLVVGGKNVVIEGESDEFKKYWYTRYRLEAAVELQQLLETQMKPGTFEKVKIPTLNLYYYKDEENQDKIVIASKIVEMHEQLATPESLKVLKAIPSAGDHVLASPIKSQDVDACYNETVDFLVNVLNIKKSE